MNLRTMPEARVLLLMDEDNGKKIIGWQGVAIHQKLNIPEKFSLHLDPEYRAFSLGLAIETAFYKYLQTQGHSYAVVRMDVRATPTLKDYRLKIGVFAPLEKNEMPAEWLAMCGNCELHNKTCMEKVYVRCDVAKGISFGEKRLGLIQAFQFPYPIVIVKERLRTEKREPYTAKWAA